jgi:hypothetical protein
MRALQSNIWTIQRRLTRSGEFTFHVSILDLMANLGANARTPIRRIGINSVVRNAYGRTGYASIERHIVARDRESIDVETRGA